MPRTPAKKTVPPGRARGARPPASGVGMMVESIVGCKWSMHVLAAIRRGIARPGALERSAEGLTAKVLAERLSKLLRFGIVERRAFAEIPPRVEYRLTPFGEKFAKLIDEVEQLERELERDARSSGA